MGVLELLLGLVPGIVKSMFPSAEDEEKAQALQLELVKAIMSVQTAQLEVNKAEAASTSLFVAGWRPGLAWICTFAFAYTYIISPIVNYILLSKGIMPIPQLGVDELNTVLMGMLGLGGLRTVEKVAGTASDNTGSIVDKLIRKKK